MPNVSLCVQENEVHYNPYVEPVETRVVAKYYVESEGSPITLFHSQGDSGSGSGSGSGGEPPFSYMEIDGVEQSEVVSTYEFSTTGEHTVKYTLADPTTIGNISFDGCYNLTSIDIPDSVTSIGNFAFANCSSLTSVTIGNSVTSIGNDAFAYCSNLTSVTIPDSVTSIGEQAFYDCTGITSCTIGSGVTSIGYDAFRHCTSLTSIVCNATTAPTITNYTFRDVKTGGTLTVPSGSSGYDTWMQNANYYLGLYGWTKVEQ